MKFLGIVVVLNLFIFCAKEKKLNLPIQISGTEILINEIDVIESHIIQDYLFLRTRQSDSVFKVYNKQDLKFVGYLGKRGEGPGEWIAPRYLGQSTIEKNALKIWVFDEFKNSKMLINVEESLNKNIPLIEKEIKIDSKYGIANNGFFNSNYAFIALPDISSPQFSRFNIFDLNKDKIIKSEMHDKDILIDLDLPKEQYYQMYSNHLSMKPDSSFFISAYNYFDRFSIFDKNGSLVVERNNSKKNEIDAAMINKDLTIYNNYLVTTNNYIYISYYNQLDENYGEELISTLIKVYDWEGNELVVFEVPDYLMEFSIDEDNQTIYGLDFYNEKFIKYNFVVPS